LCEGYIWVNLNSSLKMLGSSSLTSWQHCFSNMICSRLRQACSKLNLTVSRSFLWLLKSRNYFFLPPGFNIQKFYFEQTQYIFLCFTWIAESIANAVVKNINWLVFEIQMKSAYNAVQTGSRNKQDYFHPYRISIEALLQDTYHEIVRKLLPK
jgi:hypothetical protein